MRPIELLRRPVNHMAPSGPAVIPKGRSIPVALYLESTPAVVIRPIEWRRLQNHSSPSGPAAIAAGRALIAGPGELVTTPALGIRPAEAPDYDITLYLTAGGMMPRHRVVPPVLDGKDRPQFVLAVLEPLSSPHYRRFPGLPQGRPSDAIP